MTTTNSFTSPSDTVLVARYFLFRLKSSLKKCFSDRYFKANIVYMIYSCLLLHIDLNIGRESASDTMYTLLGYVHIINAILYIWMWSEIRSVWNFYILPDWLNIFGSFLYWVSSASQHSYSSDSYLVMRRIELFASCVELLAVVGWAVQWYWEYYMDLVNIPLSCIGRGFTLDDPDVWGIISLAIATCYYFQYNLIMYYDANDTSHASLYLYGDYWYVVNAFIYILCAMRDNEFFWFMPYNGRPHGCLEAARSHYFSSGNDGGEPLLTNTQLSNKFEYGKCKNSVSCSTSEDMEAVTTRIAEERGNSPGLGSSMEDMGTEGMNIDSNMGLLSNFLFSSPSSVTLRASSSSSSSNGNSSVKEPGKDREKDRDKEGSGSASGLINNGSYTRRSE